jgi:predicted extracellular nuclease
MVFSFSRSNKAKNLYTVAFYNLENLFDTTDNIHTLDDDFTPDGFKKWTQKRYHKKLSKLSRTISKLGSKGIKEPPALVGVAEIENVNVVKDLISTGALGSFDYSYVHYESPDERGIDTALLFRKKYFEVLYSNPIPLIVKSPEGIRDTTRDILYVRGKLNGEVVHVFVNHWPSRRAGGQETQYKRVKAAETLIEFMEEVEQEHAAPNYIIMGDFNDGPGAESIQFLVNSKTLYNPMQKLLSPTRGSANYKRTWALFDQIIVSHSFLNYEKNTHSFAHANIFDERFLREFKGRYAGSPFRTFVGKRYLGGYSDHFPVYIQLQYNT